MSTDWYTKLVLTLVAVCLGVLVVQGYREGAGAGASPEGDRYRLTVVPMARMMLRIDSDTGKTWKAMFPDLNIWTPIPDSPAELLEQAIVETPKDSAPEATAPEDSEAGPVEDAVTP